MKKLEIYICMKRLHLVLLGILLVSFIIFGSCGNPAGSKVELPDTIEDLAVIDSSLNTISLSWTYINSTNNDSATINCNFRHYYEYITDSNWDMATQCLDSTINISTDNEYSIIVNNLASRTSYYFAAKVSINNSAFSIVSNNATGKTRGLQVIDDLIVIDTTDHSITLSWTAPGIVDDTGQVSYYDIRYSKNQITELNWHLANQCLGEPIPQTAGNIETFEIAGLEMNTTYYFAMRTEDDLLNQSLLSNNIAVKTLPY